MPFEISPSDEAPLTTDDSTAEAMADARQLALRLSDTPIAVQPFERRGRVSLNDVQSHIVYLNGQLDTLRRQLVDHPADRLAMLLREMIQERERELERWLAQEQRWDERLGAIESAITERDTYRQRQAELIRERDEARREAETVAARLAAAQRVADEARRHAAALERATEKAQAEQLRLRHERELDKSSWQSEQRRLVAEAQRQDKGWLSRFIRG
jgi:chromosome segregation ATPase